MTNDEGMLINDEARMTNDEGMTKSEDSKRRVAPTIRSGMTTQNRWSVKSRRRTAFTIWKSAQRGSAKQ